MVSHCCFYSSKGSDFLFFHHHPHIIHVMHIKINSLQQRRGQMHRKSKRNMLKLTPHSSLPVCIWLGLTIHRNPIKMQLQAGTDCLDVIFFTVFACMCACVCACGCNTPGHLLAATLLQGNGPVCVFLPLFSTERQGCTLCSDRPASQGYTAVLSPLLGKGRHSAASARLPHATFRRQRGGRRTFFFFFLTVRLSVVFRLD